MHFGLSNCKKVLFYLVVSIIFCNFASEISIHTMRVVRIHLSDEIES